ncbi:Protein disulfide-isomerase tigA [Sparassis crispa]|uniref:protein disulfide-isomerase n=1 Tax=Sparassis crispa TaxID=139825 RepID=A0A401H325_9APHY|nr:Protein disulfide-isomerase tigA [Sparassis crispa]GBE88802.1 Protein disulfide-isomerase tigA [Sparassis crispa]
MKFVFSVFAAAVSLGGVWASNVLELDASNFDSVIGHGKPALVEFFAPWCGHCKNLAPVYEQLADAFAYAKDKVVIAKVDADGAGRPLGQKYDVSGFPTLKWFGPDGGEPEKYEGGRDLDSLTAFITEKSGMKSSIKPPPPPAYQILDVSTFNDVALNKEKDVLISFTAPWCGHCKRLKPIYDEVAKDFANEPNCVVANVDADAAPNKPLATAYDVQSFPTIKFFGKDSKEKPEAYEGARTEEAFVEFLNEKCGTQRTVGGGLTEFAGRLPEFDTLASQFYAATGAARDEVYKQASALAKTVGPAARHYVRVMEKVVNGSEEYIQKETKRLVSILSKRTMLPTKLDEIKIKANILGAFAPVKRETGGRAAAEL